MIKNTISIGFIIIVVVLLNSYTYATNSKITTTLNQKEENDGTIQVEVNILEMENIGEGINAYSGQLSFNTNQLTLMKLEGVNNWNTPLYNEESAKKGNTKIVATSNNFTKNIGTIFVATFEKKTNVVVDKVEFNDFEVASKIDGKTVKVTEQKDVQTKQRICE